MAKITMITMFFTAVFAVCSLKNNENSLTEISNEIRNRIVNCGGITVGDLREVLLTHRLEINDVGFDSRWGMDPLGSCVSHTGRIDRHVVLCFTLEGKKEYLYFCVDVVKKNKGDVCIDPKDALAVAREFSKAIENESRIQFMIVGASPPKNETFRFRSFNAIIADAEKAEEQSKNKVPGKNKGTQLNN